MLLLEPLDKGKLKRKAHDFLCTSQAGSNGRRFTTLDTSSSGDVHGRYASRIACKQCLATALRWTDASKRVEPELVPVDKHIW